MNYRVFLLLFLLASFTFAIEIKAPFNQEIENGGTIDIGNIGPGQTVSIEINPKVSTNGIYGNGGLYDQALVSDLPFDWTAQDSKLYQTPLQVTITAAPDAPEGGYSAKVTVVDEKNGEQLGNVTFTVKVKITYDVMDFEVYPKEVLIGPDQPARFALTITNKGSTSDVFEVSAGGSKRWAFTKPVFVPAKSAKTIFYEIVSNEEDVFTPSISVTSRASALISDRQNVSIKVRSDLLGDFSATNNGVLLFPIFESGTYSLAGLIANIFGR